MPRPPATDPPRRPRRATLVAWGVLFLGLANLWRAIGLYRQLNFLIQLELRPDPRWLLGAAVAWGFVLPLAAVVVWRGRPAARLAVPALLLLYGLWRLALAALFGQEPRAAAEAAVAAGLYALAALAAAWALRPARAGDH
ncbi:MAG: hypothetical protein ACRDHL_12460 [Candidatus Promineifilaceae bacterium]